MAKLPNGCSIFTAELWAINQAIHWILAQPNHHFLVITDSMSALQALNSTKTTARHNLKGDTLYKIRQIYA
jgi:ribonuclease HI